MRFRHAIDLFTLYVRHAYRGLRADRGFAAAAVATIAISVGLTTSIFTVADGILFRPLPYANTDRLVVPYQYLASDGRAFGTLDAGAVAVVQATRAFDAIAYWQSDFVDVVAESDELMRFAANAVGRDFFQTLGVEVMLGRLFAPDDFHAGPERPVLLMHSLWLRLGGNAAIVGQTLRLEERNVRIVGVMPASFVFPTGFNQPSALTPLGPDVPLIGNAAPPVARLREGVTASEASAELRALGRAASNGRGQPQSGVGVQSVRDAMFGTAQPVLYLLLIATFFVLVIACANLASLLLARGTERARELAVRAAIGATRRRLAGQLIVESLVLAAIGGGVGLLLSLVAFELLYGQVPGALYRLLPAGVDARVLLFTLAVSVVSGLIFGVVPAIQLSRSDLKPPLQSAHGFGTPRRSWRSGAVLVAVEVAVVVVLLAGAGLTVQSFSRLMHVDVGVDPEGVTVLSVNLPRSRYTPPDVNRFSRDLIARLRSRPWIEAVAGVYAAPVAGAAGWSAADLPNVPARAAQTWPVMFGHFETFAIAVRGGRTFSEAEVAANAPVAVLSERAADLGWPNGNAIGQLVRFRDDQPRQIIGIVGDVRGTRRQPGPATVYVPLHPNLLPRGVTEIAVRSSRDGDAVRELLIAEVRRADASVRPSVRAFADVLAAEVAIPRFQVQLFSLFSLIGLTLAVGGVLGVVQYLVSRRTREIGIRMALGASATQVRLMVLRQSLGPVAWGLAIGLATASWLTRALEPWLFEIKPNDPVTLVGVALLLSATAIGAAYLPARRAARLNPMDAIRTE